MKRIYLKEIRKTHKGYAEPCLCCQLFLQCKTYKMPSIPVSEGASSKTLFVLLDMPSREADTLHNSCVGKTEGFIAVLKEMFSDVWVELGYAVRCWSQETPRTFEIRQCSTFLKQDIERLHPTVILAIGNSAKQALREIGITEFEYASSIDTSDLALTRVRAALDDTLERVPLCDGAPSINADVVGLDFEWDGSLGWSAKAHSVGLATGTQAWGLPLDGNLHTVRDLFLSENKTIVGHNIVEDIVQAMKVGIQPRCRFVDTLVLTRELAPEMLDKSLETLAYNFLLMERFKQSETVDYTSPNDVLLRRTAGDAYASLLLYHKLQEDFAEEYAAMSLARGIDLSLIPLVAEIKHGGIKLDMDNVRKHQLNAQSQLDVIRQEIELTYGINAGSPTQVLSKLREFGHKVDSSGESILAALDTDFTRSILAYRRLNTLVTRYLQSLPKYADTDGIIHINLHIAGSNTGRLTSSNPTLLNIDNSLRDMFSSVYGEDGLLVSCDASQSELRDLAYLSQSKALIKAYKEGVDMHSLVSNLAGIDRKDAKTLNFAYVYGASDNRLIAELVTLGKTHQEASDIVNKFKKTMAKLGIEKYQQSLLAFAEEHGYIASPFGRRGYRLNPTQIVNYPIQSLSNDLNSQRALWVHKRLKEEKLVSHIWLLFHDAIELDVYKPELTKVKNILTELNTSSIIPDIFGYGITLQQPLEVKEHGKTWK